jgi:hypothetical protein
VPRLAALTALAAHDCVHQWDTREENSGGQIGLGASASMGMRKCVGRDEPATRLEA